ncbi:DUF4303 domain-containing protein [Pragia fontium]|nr:DUF4303 domain-containing protein [Pragia fontium]
MKDFFDRLEKELISTIRVDFNKLTELIKGECLYAVSLVTDSCFDSIYLGLSTEESLLRKIDKYQEKREVSEKMKSYLRWTPAEWGYDNSDIPNSLLPKVSNILRDKKMEVTSEFESMFYEVLEKVMRTLYQDGLFSNNIISSQLTLFISISDDDRALEIENDSARILNSLDVYEKFIKRFE